MSVSAISGFLEQVDGSSSFQFNSTKVVCSVTGPMDVSRVKNEHPTQAYLDITIRPAAGVPSTRESLLETKLRKILTPLIDLNTYARQQIQIVVQVLETGERGQFTVKELTAIVNSSYLSLLNSGLVLKTSFLASCCCISKGKVTVRPTNQDLDESDSHHIAVFTLKQNKVDELMFSDSMGVFDEEQLFKAYDYCAADIEQMNSTVRDIIFNRIQQDYIWKF